MFFFLDVDDKISPEILKCLYYPTIEKDLDMVFCDKQLIERSMKDLREYEA